MNGDYMGGLEANMTTRVGVYFCGPNTAARDIRAACRNSSSSGVRFQFWKEHF